MLDFMMILVGLVIWYVCFGVECWVNGAGGGWEMPFVQAYHELTWNLPFVGMYFRRKYINDDGNYASENDKNHLIWWANELPGRMHFILTCILLPLAPWLLYRFCLYLFSS